MELLQNLPEWDGDASTPETCFFLYAITRMLRPKVVVEAGTYRGHGSIHIAKALIDNGEGMVYTCDVEDHGASKAALKAGVNDRFNFRLCKFPTMLEGMKNIDMAYIDASGAPSGAGLRWDFLQLVLPKLSANGVVLLDDTASYWANVDLIREGAVLNLPACRGLSIWTKQAALQRIATSA